MRTAITSARSRRTVGAVVAGAILGAAVLPAVAGELVHPDAPEPLGRVAFVARNDLAADALGVGPVAGALGGIVVTTPTGELSDPAEQALTEFDPDTVYIAGGEVAISPATEAEVTALGSWDVERLAGENRDETAYLVGKVLADLGVGRPMLTGSQVVGDSYLGGVFHAQDIEVPDEWVQSVALNGPQEPNENPAIPWGLAPWGTMLSDTVSLPAVDCAPGELQSYQVRIDVDGTIRNQSGATRLVRGAIAIDGERDETSVQWHTSEGTGNDYHDVSTHTVTTLGPGDHEVAFQAYANDDQTLVYGARLTTEVIDASCNELVIFFP